MKGIVNPYGGIMAKKRKPDKNTEEEIKDYYKLNLDAVDRLVSADDENAPEVSEEEKKLYKTGFIAKVPTFVKALLVKYWFNGAACFFFYWGLGIYITDQWALILILGLALGLMTDLLVNNLFRFFESCDREYNPWMLLPMKKFWTFPVNIIYALALVLLVVYTYNFINEAAVSLQGLDSSTVVLGVEPLLFGLFYLVYDIIFIGIKDLIVFLIRRTKTSV